MFTIIKNLFSQRKGLSTVSEIALRDDMSESVKNAVSSCYFNLCENFKNGYTHHIDIQYEIEKELWCHYLNRNLRDFSQGGRYYLVFEHYFKEPQSWFKKLDILEYVCRWLSKQPNFSIHYLTDFEQSVNQEFERLNYGYRIVNHKVTDITSEEEKKCIEDAIEESKDNVKEHLNKAVEYYSQKPESDNRNSIKESISAVEAVCRQLTGAEDLNKALKQLNEKGIPIHERFKDGIRSFYNFTNQEDTGIRHALLKEGYSPSKAEAYFMLLSCSAFINYLRMITVK